MERSIERRDGVGRERGERRKKGARKMIQQGQTEGPPRRGAPSEMGSKIAGGDIQYTMFSYWALWWFNKV